MTSFARKVGVLIDILPPSDIPSSRGAGRQAGVDCCGHLHRGTAFEADGRDRGADGGALTVIQVFVLLRIRVYNTNSKVKETIKR
jgi:hypothetical protein